jgi:hypothetical protein
MIKDRKHWELMLPIIQAYVDGKQIQGMFGSKWHEIHDQISFDQPAERYRVKPDIEYRPYNHVELIGLIGQVVHHIGGARSMITGAHEDRVYCEGRPTTSKALLEHFTFLDGSRCGVPTEGQ